MTLNLKAILGLKFPAHKGVSSTPSYSEFRAIIKRNNQIIDLMGDMGDKLGGDYVFDRKYVSDCADKLETLVKDQINAFSTLSGRQNRELVNAFEQVRQAAKAEIRGQHSLSEGEDVIPLSSLDGDATERAGNKMAGLAHIRNRLLLPTPDGFVISSRAFMKFMQKNHLLELADELNSYGNADDNILKEAADDLQHKIMRAHLPRKLSREILSQFDLLSSHLQKPGLRVSLRSSGWGEDGRTSFAGQYSTLLNVSRDELLEGYRKVIASAYQPDTWRYRQEKGYHEHEVVMAVGCQAMTDSEISGVLHTMAPHIAPDSMMINASWGLCEPIVQGKQPADTYIVSRTPPFQLRRSEIVNKEVQLVPGQHGGVVSEETPPGLKEIPCLDESSIAMLLETALRIEQYYKRPQEIEWTFDKSGQLQILQVRGLHFRGRRFNPGQQIEHALRRAEIVFSNRGITAQCGIGVGRVCRVEEDDDLDRFPQGGILVSKYASPRFGAVMHKARGIITDIGSPTGHMAALAREYRVPTIVNTESATSLLENGEEITIDATQSVVYRGFLYALSRFELTEEEVFEDTYEYRLLKRLWRHTSRLTLIDAKDDDFTPAACRTYRDIARFIRVKAVDTFIRLSEESKIKDMSVPKLLNAGIPLGLIVIDAADGTDSPHTADTVKPQQIKSLPLHALLEGMLEPGVWCTAPVSVNLGSFMSSFTRTFCTSLSSPREIGRNLAVVLKNYMDINLRLGYHFTVMDSYMSEVIDDNYINFRFFGGVTEPARRSRRAAFIARVLEYFDFVVEIHGDLVVARLKKRTLSRMQERMRMLGGLIGYTRQLDACMNSDRDVTGHAELFVKAIKSTIGG